jgi:ferric-dicitrate binding protein FerR (iron transport regulator)
MNDDPVQRDRELHDLLSELCDGRRSEASMKRLEELIQQDASASEAVVAFAWLHTELWRTVSASHADRAAHVALANSLGGDTAATGSSIATIATSAKRSSRSLLGWTFAAIAASLVVGAAVLLRPAVNEPDGAIPQVNAITLIRPPHQVARITHVHDAAWGGGRSHDVGTLFSEGDHVELLSGTAQLSMSCGADIVLQSPCGVEIIRDDVVRLDHGKVTAQVAPWAKGFVIDAKGLRVTDLGTRFAVSADKSGVAEAHVLEGEVLAEPMKSRGPQRSSVRLNTGQAIRVDVRRAKIDQLKAERGRFVDRLEEVRPLRPVDMWNTGFGLAIGESDSHWRITSGPKGLASWPIQAVVGRPDPIYRDNSPDESQWISVPDGTTKGVPAHSEYTFETTFDLTGFDPSTVCISGRVIADNGVRRIRLNGKPAGIAEWSLDDPGVKFRSFHPIEIRSGFVPGANRLEIDVFNTTFIYGNRRPTLDNPMAIRVEWQAFGCEANEPTIAGETVTTHPAASFSDDKS